MTILSPRRMTTLLLFVSYYTSNVTRSSSTPAWSAPPPSGSTASMHWETATVCLASFVAIQTLPLAPTAASSGKRVPRSGRRKCFESSNLRAVEGCQQTSNKPESCRTALTHSRHIFKLQRIKKPPFSSPNPSDLRVLASKHSSSGSMSL